MYFQLKKLSYQPIILICTILSIGLFNHSILAADKIYHPYIEYDTFELEARVTNQHDRFSTYRLGLGKDITEKLFLELYLIGDKQNNSSLELEAYELELLYQATEQGEYWADIGFIVEIEKESESSSSEWEGNFGIILEKEIGRWSATLNLAKEYATNEEHQHHWENNMAFQLRYRKQPAFEPGFEIYYTDDSLLLGPVVMGQARLTSSKVKWEIGLLKETKDNQSDNIIRALLEYEF